MKYKIFHTLVICLLAFSGCRDSNGYTISADFGAMHLGSEVDTAFIMSDSRTYESVEKHPIADGQIKIRGHVDRPVLTKLNAKTKVLKPGERAKAFSWPIIIEPGKIELTGAPYNCAKGTPQNDAVHEFIDNIIRIQRYGPDRDKARELKDLIFSFIQQHDKELCSILVLRIGKTILSNTDIVRAIELCSSEIQADPEMKQLREMATARENTSPGHHFVDFETQYKGTSTRLSDFAGKGKFVLLDFWASWCGACRAEIPNLINIDEEYREKGLLVVGATVNDKPENSMKAIEELGITYPNILAIGQEAIELYSIQSIPDILLIAPDGTILERGLRGSEIIEAVRNALNE